MARIIGIDQVHQAHAIEIHDFLQRPAGQAMMNALAARRPKLNASSVEKAGTQGLRASGWEECMTEIITISEERGEVSPLIDKPMNMSLADDAREDKKPLGKV